MDDEDILAALRLGDTDGAFRDVLRLHGPAVFSICCRILRNAAAAEDVMQDVLIASFNRRAQLLDVAKLRGWLIRVATRKCIDAIRKARRAGRLHDAMLREVEELAPNPLERNQGQRALEECLAALDPEIAAAVLLRYHEAMTWEEISESLGIPRDTIRMRVQRGALKSLRECLTSKGVDV